MPGPVFIEGDTITLRTVEEEDIPLMQRLLNHPEIRPNIGRSDPINAEQEREFFEEEISAEGSVELLVSVDGEGIGLVGLDLTPGAVREAELGYWLDPEYHEQGYGSEAARLLTEYGINQRGCHRIEARVFEHNAASQNLLESLGFTQEGRQREAAFVDGEYRDIYWYAVLAEEW